MSFSKLILSSFLFFYAIGIPAMDFSSIKGKFSCPEINNSQLCAQSYEKNLLPKYSSINRVTEKQIELTALTGEKVIFTNSWTSNSYQENANYTLLDVLANNRFALIHKQYWEGNAYTLVSLKNGLQIALDGYPAFSPNLRFMVVADQDLEAEYNPNTLKVYEVIGDSFTLIYDSKPTNWGPDRVEWISNSELKYVKMKINPDYSPENDVFYLAEEKNLNINDVKD